jgi:hypothetical protein
MNGKGSTIFAEFISGSCEVVGWYQHDWVPIVPRLKECFNLLEVRLLAVDEYGIGSGFSVGIASTQGFIESLIGEESFTASNNLEIAIPLVIFAGLL